VTPKVPPNQGWLAVCGVGSTVYTGVDVDIPPKETSMTETDQAPAPPQWERASTTPPSSGLMRNPVVPGAIMTGLGGLLIVFGSFLPWLTATAPFIGTINVNGMQGGGDGVITLVLGVITILIAATQLTATKMPALLWRSSIITGVITGAVAIYDYNAVQQRITELKTAVKATGELSFDIPVAASVGTGIWALFIGAALAILGGILVRKIPTS
jgi:hypothetical protein